MERRSVLFLPKWYPNKYDVLDGVFVVDHARAVALYHNVHVLFVHSDDTLERKFSILSEQNSGYDETIIYFRKPASGSKVLDDLVTGIRYLRAQFKGYRLYRKKKGQPDLIHVHVLLRSSILARWLFFIKRIPFVITEHWSGYDPGSVYKISWFKKKMLRAVLRHSAAVMPVSDYLRDHMQVLESSANYHTVGNCIDEALFCPAVKSTGSTIRFIHVSTLDDYPKNFGNLLRAIALAAKRCQNFEVIVIGKGEEKEKQVRLARELGILDSIVFFKGYLEKKDVAAEMAKSDALLLFSHYETQSCVALESMSCGVPVIGSAVGGLRELIRDTNGILVAPNDIPAYAGTLEKFVSGQYRFDPGNVRNSVKQFSYAATGGRISGVYELVLHKREAAKEDRVSSLS